MLDVELEAHAAVEAIRQAGTTPITAISRLSSVRGNASFSATWARNAAQQSPSRAPAISLPGKPRRITKTTMAGATHAARLVGSGKAGRVWSQVAPAAQQG